MVVRTNVGASLVRVEGVQVELVRRLGVQGERLVVLESVVELLGVELGRVVGRVDGLVGEVERLSADLDVALADLDAIQAGP